MTIFTDGPLMEPEQVGIRELPLSTGRYVGESFAQGLEESPVAGLLRAREVAGANGRSPEDVAADPYFLHAPTEGSKPAPAIPMGEAKKRVKEAGLEHQIPNLGDGPEIGEGALDVMMRHARERAHREAQLARGPSGILPGVAATGAGFFAGAIDPLNIAAFSVPVVGEARVARLMASAGESAMARAGVRAGIGAVQGAVGTLPLIPLDAMAYSMDGRDYGFADALKGIAMNAGLGGVFHAAGGGIADIYRGYTGKPLYPFAPGEPFDRTPGTPPASPAGPGGAVPPPPVPGGAPPSPAPPVRPGEFPTVDELLAHPEVAGRTAHPRAGFNVSDVLSTPHVAEAIETPDINREHDVPYGSLAADAGGVFIDRNVPVQAEIDGVKFSPALPLNVARQVEREALERLTARFQADKGREPTDRELEQIIQYTNKHYVTPAEKAWVTSRGIDWDKYQEAKRDWQDKIDHENPANPPEGAYTKPLPPRLRDRLRGGAPRAEAPPEPAPRFSAGPAVWANKDVDLPVYVVDEPPSRGPDGRWYQKVQHEGRDSFVPLDELRNPPDSPPVSPRPTDAAAPEQPPQEASPVSAAEPPAATPSPEDTSAGALAATFRDELAKMRAEEAQTQAPAEPEPLAATPADEALPPEFRAQPSPGPLPNKVGTFAPGDLLVDANRFQFKSGGDENGVSDRLKGVKIWDDVKSGIVIVWEDNGGKFWIVDGHQRLALATRIAAEDPAQNPRLVANILREADGITDTAARAYAAAKNISEGTGTAIDAAKVLRDRPDLIDVLPPRSELVRQAHALANLTDEAFLKSINDEVPPNYAAIVGRLAPQDGEMQRALLGLLTKTDPSNAIQAEAIVRQGIEARTGRLAEGRLFSDDDIAKSHFTERARVLDLALKDFKKDKTVFAVLSKEKERIEEAGNTLASEINERRLSADAHALQVLQILAARSGAVADALDGAAKRARADGKPGPAVREFVAAVRRLAESGDLARLADGLDRGPAHAGAQDAASVVDPAPEQRSDRERVAEETKAAAEVRSVINEAAAPRRRKTRLARLAEQVAEDERSGRSPAAPPEPTTGEVAKAAGKAAVSALDEAATGLWELFGKGKRPFGGLPGFDEETYAAAKPHFVKAAYHFREFTGNVHELMRRLVRSLKEKYGFNLDAIEAMEPYAIRFVQDVHEGRIDLKKAVTEEQRAAITQRLAPMLRAAGRPEDEAQMVAAAVADRYVARAAAFGEDPMAAFERANVEVHAAEGIPGIHLGEGGRQFLQIKAWHGSPADFPRFDMNFIGTGEKHQSFGPGLYFGGEQRTGEHYRDTVTRMTVLEQTAAGYLNRAGGDRKAALEALREAAARTARIAAPGAEREIARQHKALADLIESGWNPPQGHLYQVTLRVEPEDLLDWDKPLSKQSEKVRNALQGLENNIKNKAFFRITENDMQDIRRRMFREAKTVGDAISALERGTSKAEAARVLKEAGIPGIRYLDQGSRAAGEGTHNYVIFDDSKIEITHRDGTPVKAQERQGLVDRLTQKEEGKQFYQRALGPGWEVGADGTLARTHSNPPEDSGEFWTPNRVDRLREMRGEGKSFSEIGDEFGVSRDVIAGKWRRLQRPPPEPRGKVDVARLRELRAQGMNAQDIAKEFGVTRTGINWHLEQIGLLPTREEMNKISFADLKKLRDKGLSAEEISAQTGVALEAIQSKLNWLRALLRDLPTLASLPKLEFLKKPVEEFSAKELAEFERLFGYKEPGEGRTFEQRPTAPTFYSAVERAVTSAKQAKASPDQWLGMLRNMPGVKPEEMEWLGLEDWLKEQKGPVSKEQVADYVRANQIEVKEVQKGGERPTHWTVSSAGGPVASIPLPMRFATREEGAAELARRQREHPNGYHSLSELPTAESMPKFESYQLPGGENYRELLLTLPDTGANEKLAQKWFGKPFSALSHSERDFVIREAKTEPPAGEFRSSHFDEPNILAHVRFNDRTIDGKRTLFVEEVQSDWHQKGRELGYQGRGDKADRLAEIEKLISSLPEQIRRADVEHQEAQQRHGNFSPEERAAHMRRGQLSSQLHALQQERAQLNKGVPDAPFKTTWPELAMKRMIRYAAENGYDQVAWTTGATQNARYKLSDQIEKISARPRSRIREPDSRNPSGREVAIDLRRGQQIRLGVNHEGIIDWLDPDNTFRGHEEWRGKHLADVIGKDLADHVMRSSETKSTEIAGEGLDIGGHGMLGFYDQILPATVNKLTKKFGGKVGTGFVKADNAPDHIVEEWAAREPDHPFVKKNRTPVHTLPITDKLREAATEQGFPLFQPGAEGEPQGRVTFTNNARIIELFKKANASTAPHEFGHVWLDELHEDAARPDAPQWLKDDLKTVRDWLGAKGDDPLTTEQHEQFARGFEQYLREGRAPSRRLAAVFAKFAEWMRAIYRKAQDLGVEINDDVRGVMDRMLATHEDIAEYANDRPPLEREPMEHPPAPGEEAGPTVNPATGSNEVLPPVQSQEVLKGAIGSLIEGRPVRAGEQIEGTKEQTPAAEPATPRAPATSGPRAKDPADRSLFEHLAANGGIKPDADLQHVLGRAGPFVPGWGPLLRPNGKPIDLVVRDGDVEAYLGKGATVRDLMAAINDESRGRKRYQMGNEPVQTADTEASRAAHEREVMGMLEDAGIARDELGSDRIARVIEIMQREHVDNPEVAFEQAVMEEARRHEDAGNAPAVPPELHVPGWDDDGTAAPQESGVLQPFESAQGGGTGTPAPSGGQGPRAPPPEPVIPRASLADHFRDYFLGLPEFTDKHSAHLEEGNRFPTIVQARRFAKEMGFGDDAKAIDEAIEQGAVAAARTIALGEGEPADKFAELVKLYDRQPRLSVRTSTSMRDQAYSTPVPLAYLASRLAGIERVRRIYGLVYEPSAGNGALLMEALPDRTYANEINPDRARALEDQGFRVTQKDASDPAQGKYLRSMGGVHAVIANPPFGAVKEGTSSKVFDLGDIQRGYKTHEIDHAIALHALEAMKDDGRAVLLIGGVNKLARTPEARSDAYNGKAKREFFKVLQDRYNVTDMFTVAGELYERQGAGWPIDVIVIEGRGKSARPLPAVEPPRVYKTWDELAEVLNAQPGRDEGTPGAEPGATPVELPPATEGAGNAGGGEAAAGPSPGTEPAPVARPEGVQPGTVSQRPGGDVAAGGERPAPAEEVEPAGGRRGAGGLPDEAAAGGRALGLTEPLRLVEALRNATRTTKIGGETDIVADPHAENILKRSPDDLRKIEAILAANGITELKPLAGGFSSLVLDAGDKVVRLGEGELGPLPDIPEYAKPFAQGEFGSLRIEILPKLDTEGITEADVQEMKDRLARRGLHWGDAGTDNLARDEDGKLKILDGRITPTGDGEAPPAAKIPSLKGAEKSAAPAPKPVTPRIVKTETETGAQVAYTPKSGHNNLGTLIPVNMKKSAADALASLAERHGGDVDHFVAKELGYDPEELGKYLAAEQIDAVALALDNIKQGKGFIVGDQTGIGKGRVNASIIRWAHRNNRIPIFVTEKPNLYGDMYRDLRATDFPGMLGREPRSLITNADADVPLSEDGTVHISTPSAKAHNAMLASLPRDAKSFLKQYDVVFTTYNQMQPMAGEDTARRGFLRTIAPESVLILDESHNGGGQQKGFAKAGPADRAGFAREMVAAAKGVFYSSATYAKRPDVMDLYSKTDMRLAVDDIKNLGEAIAKGGVPMQQAVAAMLARSGQYLRRERSFAGIEYGTPTVDVNRAMYDGISRSLNLINQFSRLVKKAAEAIDESIKAEAAAVSGDNATGDAGARSTNFTSIMHNVISQMLLALKAKPAAKMALEALERGEKPVLTVSGTMESFINGYVADLGIKPGEPIPADFGDVLKKYLDRTRTLIIKKPFMKKGEKGERKYLTDAELGPAGVRAYKEAKKLIESLDLKDLPVSPIDAIKDELRAAGYSVGEITGRGTIVDYSDKRPILRSRPGTEVSIKGRRDTISRFNGGGKDKPLPKEKTYDAMILNQAGSTGLSLHASEDFADQRPRVMFIVQPEANIDTHMQLLGRIHRTGQVVLPRYAQLTADIPAEKRPAAVLAKKMASLNANTTAARGSAMTAKDVPDFLNVYGDMVAAALVQENPELNWRLGEPVKVGEGGRIEAEGAMKDLTGRIPLLPLAEQERLYSYLESEYNSLLDQMKAAGENALEAQTLDLRAQTVERREVVARREASDSPFAAPVSLEKAMVRRLGKPFRSDEVVSKILDNIGHTPPEGVTADNAARLLDDLSSKRTPLGQRAAQVHERQAKDALGRFDDYKRGILDDIDNPDKAEAEREKQDATRDRWTGLHNQLAPGERVNLKTANGNLAGIVLKIEQKGKPKNPLALSTWKVEVAIADATRRIELPFSRLYEEGRAPQDDQLAIEVGHITDWAETKQKTLQRFDSLQSDSLEPRYIATGNLLAAYDWLKRKGRIVNYTDDQGHTRQGILTPKDFDLAKHAEENATGIGDEHAVMQWLRDNPSEWLTTNDGAVKVSLNPRVGATIEVAGARRVGGVYFLDQDLTTVMGRDFVKRGSAMTANIREANLSSAIARIQELGGKFVAVKELPPAEEVATPPPRPTAAPKEETWKTLASEPRPHEEREAVDLSRAAEKMAEPASVATKAADRVKAAEKLSTEAAEQYESAKDYMSDEDRAAFEAAQQEYDREQARKAEAIRQSIACLSAGGIVKGTGKT